MRIVTDDLWLCDECTIAAVSGGFEFLDDNYTKEKAKSREEEILAGLDELGPHLVPNFDSNADEGILVFSWLSCDCCNTSLGGSRYHFAVLGE